MKRGGGMLIPTIILGVLALLLVAFGRMRGAGEEIEGLRMAWRMTLEVLPLLVFAFVVAGMVQVLVPQEPLTRWIGKESGLRGILIGAATGAIAPGGPYVSLPIVAMLMRAGAGVGTLVAFVTGWSLWAVSRLPLEVGILGWKLTLVRLASTLVFPPLAGIIAQTFFKNWN
jgi:uncharacterized membrane protein YraQ (UPF0718 family)